MQIENYLLESKKNIYETNFTASDADFDKKWLIQEFWEPNQIESLNSNVEELMLLKGL